jgi:transposase-like protein
MVELIVTKHCPECRSNNIVKNGKDYKGDQKFPDSNGFFG